MYVEVFELLTLPHRLSLLGVTGQCIVAQLGINVAYSYSTFAPCKVQSTELPFVVCA
jgi:hypothetical protein